MRSRIQHLNHCLAAGAVAGLVTTLLIWLVSRLHFFEAMGIALVFPLAREWIYGRVVWGGLWGFLFLLPVLRRTAHWKRGLVLGLVPAGAALFFFLPFKDDKGMLGLDLGAMMPVVVIVFNLLWGYLAGVWLEQSIPEGD